ncbi:MAG: GNAT family N-acetyltransferase [Chitinophagaceae bacterium]
MSRSYLHGMPVLTATLQDIPQLVALINSAYRGDASKKGWTTEADLLKGEIRTNEETMAQLMQTKGSEFLKYINEQNEIEGCVFLDKKGTRLYLGMLSVSPLVQAKGTGKQLMNAATNYAKREECNAIYMRVISLRHELISWYEKQGYYKTGQTEAFPDDNRFGIPTQPLEFLILEKMI